MIASGFEQATVLRFVKRARESEHRERGAELGVRELVRTRARFGDERAEAREHALSCELAERNHARERADLAFRPGKGVPEQQRVPRHAEGDAAEREQE